MCTSNVQISSEKSESQLTGQTVDDKKDEEGEENQVAEHVLATGTTDKAETTHCGLEQAF